jgi:hypothetical protein
MVKFPLENGSREEVLDFKWPDPLDPGRTEGLRKRILQIRLSLSSWCPEARLFSTKLTSRESSGLANTS